MPLWHTLSLKAIERELETDTTAGLSSNEVKKRFILYGANQLTMEKGQSALQLFARQFVSPLIFVLFVSSGILFFLDDLVNAGIIVFVLVFNAIVGAIQEGRAQQTLRALKQYIQTTATVVRDEKTLIIPDTELVPGDIILLQEGEKVPADARLIDLTGLRINESALTGESVPVDKTNETLKRKNLEVTERINMVFKGSAVVSGDARACVVATGANTQIGKIGIKLSGIQSDIPLQREIRALSRKIVLLVCIVGIFLFSIGVLLGRPVIEMFKTIVSLTVSIIPEGLPIILTVVLAHGVWRMAKRHTIVKKMQAVEALGQATIIAVDKTGTITRNEMVVRKIVINSRVYECSGAGYTPEGAITIHGGGTLFEDDLGRLNHIALLVLANANAHSAFSPQDDRWHIAGDPSEAALVVAAHKLGLTRENTVHRISRHGEVPFHYKKKYHATLNRVDGEMLLILVGAPEILLEASTNLAQKEKDAYKELLASFSKQGLRILALAHRPMNATQFARWNGGELPDMTWGGFFCMEDSLREEVRESVDRAHAAGLRVVMMTGDHVLTAQAIAHQAGIFRIGDRVLTGDELEQLSPDELARVLETTSVFARVTPEHKLLIIQGYKQRGAIIAMTGDGVNDAPALVAADLGIAMGRIGTEVAKEASDIVLLDDNLSTIVAAIEEGRAMHIKIKRVILFLFGTNAGEVLLIAIALLMALPLPLNAAQIIWLNLVTDTFLDVSIGMESKNGRVLSQRAPSRRLFDATILHRILALSLPGALSAFAIFTLLADHDIVKASTLALTTYAIAQWFNAWNVRSETLSIFKMNPFSNRYLVGALGIVVTLQCAALYVPALQGILKTVPLNAAEWALCIMLASSVVIVEEVRKFSLRMKMRYQETT